MHYRILDFHLNLVDVPVILKTGTTELFFENGRALAAAVFDMPYRIDRIGTDGEKLVLSAHEDEELQEKSIWNSDKNVFDGAEY